MIEFENVTKRFGDRTVVDDLQLEIPEGTLFAFVGPNGAGKTTTIKMLVGLLRPSSGACRLFGHDIIKDSMAAKALVSYIPDQPQVYGKLTGWEFMDLVGRMYGMNGDSLRSRIAEMSELFELKGFYEDLIEQYSHGMKQRCVMAAALLHEPRVLVVDEPMVGLDPKNIRRIKDVFRDFVSRGNIVFMSTHTLSNVEEMAGQIGLIHQGRLLRSGTLAEVKEGGAGTERLEESFLRLTAEEGTT